MHGISPTATLAIDAHAIANPLILTYPWALWDFLYIMYGNYTEENILYVKEQLNTPITDIDTLQSHNVSFHRLANFLDSIGQSMSNIDLSTAYLHSLAANPQYVQAIHLYKQSQPLAARTINQLTAYVELNAPNVAVIAPVLGYAAASTAPPPRARNHPRATTSRRPPSPPLRRAHSPSTTGRQTHTAHPAYCFVHGYGGHTGSKCRVMLADSTTYSPQHISAQHHTTIAGGASYTN